jgi:hypothetical protein
LHTKTALSACYVMAYNTPGFFSVNRDRAQAITTKLDVEFLEVNEVFYHLDDETAPIRYPICTRFNNWEFPHGGFKSLDDWKPTEFQPPVPSLPIWDESEMSQAVKLRDEECRTTNYTSALDTCYLIPKAENRWVCSHSYLLQNTLPFNPVRGQRHGSIL